MTGANSGPRDHPQHSASLEPRGLQDGCPGPGLWHGSPGGGGAGDESRREKSEEITAENIPSLVKDINLRFKELSDPRTG